MSKPIFKYCLHRTLDGQESIVAVADAEDFIAKQAALHWRAMSVLQRARPGAVEQAIAAAFADAQVALHRASLKV